MLGVMDWGIGGLSVYKALREAGENSDVLYFSDCGYTPYGRTGRPVLRERLARVGAFFRSRGVNEVCVACNAASSALDSDQEILGGARLNGIIPAGVRAALSTRAARVGLIGGELTIASGIYQTRLAQVAGKSFAFATAQSLSAFVESGELDGPRVESSVTDVVARLGDIEALVLACTHYPALGATFKKIAPHVELLDPARFVRAAPASCSASALAAGFRFVTTGDADASRRAARLAFGLELCDIENAVLSERRYYP